MAEQPTSARGIARAQRVLATMAATVMVVAVLAIAVLFLVAGTGADLPVALLRFIGIVPLIALPLALLLLIALITVSVIRRSRAQRG